MEDISKLGKTELQKRIDSLADIIKQCPKNDTLSLERYLKDVLSLYELKKVKFGLSIDNKMGLGVIKQQYYILQRFNKIRGLKA